MEKVVNKTGKQRKTYPLLTVAQPLKMSFNKNIKIVENDGDILRALTR